MSIPSVRRFIPPTQAAGVLTWKFHRDLKLGSRWGTDDFAPGEATGHGMGAALTEYLGGKSRSMAGKTPTSENNGAATFLLSALDQLLELTVEEGEFLKEHIFFLPMSTLNTLFFYYKFVIYVFEQNYPLLQPLLSLFFTRESCRKEKNFKSKRRGDWQGGGTGQRFRD